MDIFPVTLWERPLSESAFIVPRDSELEKIHDALSSRSICTASIEGAYGVGKTFLAKQYAEKYRRQYNGGIHYFQSPIPAQHYIERLVQQPEKNGNLLTLYVIDETEELALRYDEDYCRKFLHRYKKTELSHDTV